MTRIRSTHSHEVPDSTRREDRIVERGPPVHSRSVDLPTAYRNLSPPTLERVLHGARDRPDALFDQARRLANIAGHLPPIVENTNVPLQSVLGSSHSRRLTDRTAVSGLLHKVGLRSDTIGHHPLLAPEALQSGEYLGALLRQIIEGGGERSQQLVVTARLPPSP